MAGGAGIEPALTEFWRLADFQLSYPPMVSGFGSAPNSSALQADAFTRLAYQTYLTVHYLELFIL